MVLFSLSVTQWNSNRLESEEGNSKATQWYRRISKLHALKQMNESPKLTREAVEKSAQSDEKLAHPRRVLSGAGLCVQYIEHMFMSPTFLVAKLPAGCKSLFNILNKYSILGTTRF